MKWMILLLPGLFIAQKTMADYVDLETKKLRENALFIGIVTNETTVFNNPDFSYSERDYTIGEGRKVIVILKITSKDTSEQDLYVACSREDCGFIRKSDVHVLPVVEEVLELYKDDEEFITLNQQDIADKSKVIFDKEQEELQLRYDDYKGKTLVVTGKEIAFSNAGSEFGLDLRFYNESSKDIKYVYVTIKSYNRVGDLTEDDFGRSERELQIIGPLKAKTESSVTFDDLFWDKSDVIDYLVITDMYIIFMDGTETQISAIEDHIDHNLVYNGKGDY